MNGKTSQTPPPFASRNYPSNPEVTKHLPSINKNEVTKNPTTAPSLPKISDNELKPSNVHETKKSSKGIRQWYR
jgi:hypothetical protein